MPRVVRLSIVLIPLVLVISTLGVWAYHNLGRTPVEPPIELVVKTVSVAGITFELEHELLENVNISTTAGPDSIRLRRRDDIFDFDIGLVTINEIGMPDVKAGDVIRWNLSGPLLVNGQPVEPHPLQARPIDAHSHDPRWTPLPSSYPRDTLSVAWAGTSRVLVVAHGDGAVRAWDVDKAEVLKTMIPDPPKEGRGNFGLRAAVSPDGKTIAVASTLGEEVTLWDLATGNKTATYNEPKGKVTALLFASDTGLWEARDGVLYSRDIGKSPSTTVERHKVHAEFSAPFAKAAAANAWCDGKKLTLEPGVPPLATIADLKEHRFTIEPVSSSAAFGFSTDGLLLAVFDGDSRLAIYDVQTGKVHRRLRWRGKLGTANSINALAFSPDAKTLAVGDNDSIRLYDVATGRERGGLSCPWVRALAYSADGRTLATGLRYQPGLRLWETAELIAK